MRDFLIKNMVDITCVFMYYLSHHIQSSNISECISYIMFMSKAVFSHEKYKYNFFSTAAHNEALGLLQIISKSIEK